MIITNEAQYKVTQERVEQISRTLSDIEASEKAKDPLWLKLQRNSHLSLIEDLRNQMKEYDALREGKARRFVCSSLEDLPQALIKARIARRLSVDELAEQLGWKKSLLKRYEENEYQSASWEKILEVADALRVKVESVVSLKGEPKSKTSEEVEVENAVVCDWN
ncbi:MAG: helix-turn-helix transcriptional regulator [Pyrinomonadaceae bacterium]